MPRKYSRKRYTRRKRRGRKSTMRKSKRGTYRVPRPFGAISRFVGKGGWGSEIKTLDYTFGGNGTVAWANAYTQDVQVAGNIFPPLNIDTSNVAQQQIMNMMQGAGVSQRIGNKITGKSVKIKLTLYPTGQVLLTPSYARLALVYDRQTNGAYVATNTIFTEYQNNNLINTNAYPFLDNLDVNSMERYVVLMDKLFTLPPSGPGGAATSTVTTVGPTGEGCMPFIINEYIPLKNLEALFKANTNAGGGIASSVTNIVTGGLLLISMGSVAAATAPWCWSGTVRLRFHDN